MRRPLAHRPAPRLPRLTLTLMEDTVTADPETETVEGRIVDDREWPPTDETGWWLWLPGSPA